MLLKVNREALLAVLDSFIGQDGFLSTIIHLFQNDVTPTADSLPADFDEATYTGYAAANVLILGLSYDDGAGQALIELAAHAFQPTGTAISNVIYGYWLEGGPDGPAVGKLYAAARLDEPRTLASGNDILVVQSRFALGFPIGIPG